MLPRLDKRHGRALDGAFDASPMHRHRGTSSMTSDPVLSWPNIAAAVASEALLGKDAPAVVRRLLRGLMTVHGLHGALVARHAAPGAPLVPFGVVGMPDERAGMDATTAWSITAARIATDGIDGAVPMVQLTHPLERGGEGVLLLAAPTVTAAKRASDDGRAALQLALRIDDANEERQVERQERDRLKSIIEATEAGTWEWHVPSGIARMNERWAKIGGRDLRELEPLSVDTWSSLVHPDDLPGTVDRLEAHLSGRAPSFEAVYRIRHKNGAWRWVQDRGRIVRLTGDGRPDWMVGSHVDITPIKDYETRLEAANEALKTQTALLSAAGRLALVGAWTYSPGDPGPTWSDIVCQIHDLPAGHHPSLAEAIAYYTDAGRDAIKDAVAACLADGTPWDLELEITTATGRRRWVHSQGEAVAQEGRIVRILGAFQDITERKGMQDALRTANVDLEARVQQRTQELELAKRVAEEASRAKDEFLTNISHELRSPLHSILGFTGLVLDDFGTMDPATLRRFIEKSRSSASELLKLVNDLLDAAKIESGKLVIQPEPCHLGLLVDEVAGEFEVAIRNKGLSMDISLQDELELSADAGRLGQAIRNVFANAVRFSPPLGRIHVSTNRPRPGLARLVIRDEGPGVPESELDAIFDRFTQSSRTKTGAGGTGLGLPIARGIIDLHGGRLWAERPTEGGTAFCFELPTP